MPTGYTEIIGKGCTFKEYLLRCSRQFGAMVRFREESLSKVIMEVKPDEYHLEKMEEAEDHIKYLKSLRPEECSIHAHQEYTNAVENYNRQIHEHEELESKYRAMLVQAQSWTPPTPDHEGLKAFMVKQIRSSIDFDCDVQYYKESLTKLAPLSGSAWLKEELRKAEGNLKYHSEGWEKEQLNADRTNNWIKELLSTVGG